MLALSGYQSKYHFNLTTTTYFAKELSLYEQAQYLFAAGLVTRAQFYAVWKFMEASALYIGIGYSMDPNAKIHQFHGARQVHIRKIEFGENSKVMLDSWNCFTANWLRRYVYSRIPYPSLKLPVTFFFSAFWHGFYGIQG
jgi:hypothetical protein